jgi:hypothetical protein
MKGPTAASIMRLVEEWHKELGREENQPTISWRRSPFKHFQWVEGDEALGNMRVWTITELLTSRALFVEGEKCTIAWRPTRTYASAARLRFGPCNW